MFFTIRSSALITGTTFGIISGGAERLACDPNSPRMPKHATYAATKACFIPYTRILIDELKVTDVKIQARCPGAIITGFHTIQRIDPAHMPPEIGMKVEELVEGSLKGLDLSGVICIPSLEYPYWPTKLEDSQLQMLNQSGAGGRAKRYSK